MIKNRSNEDVEFFKREVAKDWTSLKDISLPEEESAFQSYVDICRIAIEQSPAALQFIQQPKDKNIISDAYLELYLTAINHDEANLNLVSHLPLPDAQGDKKLENNQFNMCKAALKLNASLILEKLESAAEGSALYGDYLNLALEVVQLDNPPIKDKLLSYVKKPINPLPSHQKDSYATLCLSAVKKYPENLKYMDDEMKKMVIDTLSLAFFISMNPSLIDYFPSEFKEQADKIFKNYLHTKSYLIIAPEPLEGESKDAYFVYSNHPNRKDKCWRLPSDINLVKALLQNIPAHNNVKLVFIGHTLVNSDRISEYDAKKITECINSCQNIQEIVLLGCKTAELLEATEEEKKLLAHYKNEKLITESGFMMVRNDIFKTIEEKPYQALNNYKLPNCFFLTEGEKAKEFDLLFINSKEKEVKKYAINEEKKHEILKIITIHERKINSLPVPSRKNSQTILRDKNKPLQFWETERVFDIIHDQYSKFDRKNIALYKENKKIFPFLSNVTLEQAEFGKINSTCLLGKVLNELKEQKIRPIGIKAFTGVLCTDIKELRFYSIHSNARIYKPNYKTSFFEQRIDNINRDKLLEEQHDEMKNLNKEKSTTLVKSIRARYT